MTTYRIPAANAYTLECQLEQLSKRAAKLKLEPITYQVVREEVTKRKTDHGVVLRRWFHFEVSGGTAQLNGWHFVAAITPTDNGNIIAGMPGEEVPAQYQAATMDCEHCGKNRYRKAVYVIRHDDGRTAQVGANCLGDFVGHAWTPAQLAAAAEFERSLVVPEGDEGWGGGGYGARSVDTLEFLCTVAALARHKGFATRKMVQDCQAAESTADIAWNICTWDGRTLRDLQDDGWEVTPADVERAQVAIDWAQLLDGSTDTFTNNMKVSALNAALEKRTAGIAAYLIEAYRKAHEEEVKATTATHTSQHIGEIGKRLVLDNLTVARIREFEGDYGTTYFISMQTADGDDVVWKASTYQDWAYQAEASHQPVSLKATIKEHSEFRGTAQTYISRAQLVG